MFKFILEETGEVLGFADETRYIKWNDEFGCYVRARNRQDADGIAFNSIPYNIIHETQNINRRPIPDAPVVLIKEVDGGQYIFADHNQVVEDKANVIALKGIICDLDSVICDQAEAIIELDDQINGGE